MSTQPDIYAAGSENRPPMLNKEKYISWSRRLFRNAKRKSNKKLIVKSILEGPYQYRMIEEPSDTDHTPPVLLSSHFKIDDELTVEEAKQVKNVEQAIQIILMGLLEDIYGMTESCNTVNEIW
nr:hypothetical protein [Tanacetum cinerariifolium]